MRNWTARLGKLGTVYPFDYDYQAQGKRRPDAMPKLLARHRAIVQEAQAAHPEAPIVLAGRSMGGRVGCHLSVEMKVSALVCFGYPLFGQGNPARARDEILVALTTPVLFVQGTRDRLCPLDALDDVRSKMRAPNALHVVPTGDHGLLVTKTHTKTTGREQSDEDEACIQAIAEFL